VNDPFRPVEDHDMRRIPLPEVRARPRLDDAKVPGGIIFPVLKGLRCRHAPPDMEEGGQSTDGTEASFMDPELRAKGT